MANAGANHDCSTYGAYEMDLRNSDGYYKFQVPFIIFFCVMVILDSFLCQCSKRPPPRPRLAGLSGLCRKLAEITKKEKEKEKQKQREKNRKKEKGGGGGVREGESKLL